MTHHLSQYHLKQVPGGYHISYAGLRGLFTNVTYLGYWIHQGEIVSKENHEAIVEEELFWYAFNRLSPYTITGERNERENGYTRYSRKDPIPALLKNVIGSREGGRVYVSTSGLTEKPIYIIEEKDQRLVLKYHAATPCKEIDELFTNRLIELMKQTTRYEHYRDYAAQLQQEQDQLTASIDKQLTEIDKQMDGIVTTLSLPPEKLKKHLREKLAEKYSLLEEQKAELEEKRAMMHSDQKTQKLMEYYALADTLAENWEMIPFVDKQSLAEVLVKGVYLDEMTAHWLRLEVEWLDPQWGTERVYIFRPGGAHKTWTDNENEIISEMYSYAPREEILTNMPRRSWAAIVIQARKLKVNRPRHLVSTCGIPDTVSMEDLTFMKEASIVKNETSCHKWETVRQRPP